MDFSLIFFFVDKGTKKEIWADQSPLVMGGGYFGSTFLPRAIRKLDKILNTCAWNYLRDKKIAKNWQAKVWGYLMAQALSPMNWLILDGVIQKISSTSSTFMVLEYMATGVWDLPQGEGRWISLL